MNITKSRCGRFVVLDGLHLDRVVFENFSRWADAGDLRVQDALQLALCDLVERATTAVACSVDGLPAMPAEREH